MKKPAAAWKPVPVAVQVKRHHKAVVAARKAAAHHPSKAATAKRSVAAKKAAATRAKHRKWSPDEDVALCSARAVAESLRLATGVRVRDRDVLALHEAAGGDRDGGAPILAVLVAAQRTGLRGHRPVTFTPVPVDALDESLERLIIGADVPEPHALVADAGLWWSWGDLYDPAGFPGAVVEEAWSVTW